MFGNRVKGITVEIGGDVTKLDKALNKTDANLLRVQKDLKEVEKALKLDPTNVDLLAQKQRLLAEQADLARQRLSTMEQAAANLDDTISKSQLDAFNLELDLTKANAADAARQLEDFKDPLAEIGSAAGEAADGFDRVDGSAGKMSDGFTVAKGVMADLASKGISFLVEKALELLSAIWNLDEATEEYRKSMGLLNTAYEDAGFNQDLAKESYRGFYEILGDTGKATEAAQLLSNLAGSEKEVAKWIEIAAGVYGKFGEAIPIESLIEAANETVKTGEVAGALSNAFEWVGISSEEVNKQLETMVDKTGKAQYLMGLLSTEYSDAAASFYENNNAIIDANRVQAEVDDSLADIGQAVAEIKTQLFEAFGPTINDLAHGSSEAMQMISDGISRIGNEVGPSMEKLNDALSRFVEAAAPALEPLLDVLGKILSIFADIATFVLETAIPTIEALASVAEFALRIVSTGLDLIGDALSAILDSISSVIKWFQKLFGFGDEVSSASIAESPEQIRNSQTRSFAALFSPSPPDLDDFPHFASGGVFAPNNPMLGVLGDNPREVEIAAPRSAMQDAFLDALDQRSVGAASKFNVNIRFTGSLAQLGRLLQPVVTVETARQGPSFAR